MENFSFNDIFATKGVEYLLIIAFLALLTPFWVLLSKQVRISKQIQNTLGIISANILRIPQGLFYNKNHTWTHLEKSGLANVGLDDLLQHLTGKVTFSNLKDPGETINKGDLLAEINHNNKLLKIFSPISGKIVKTNTKLNENPEMLNEDPYGKGWVYKIKPSNWIAETNNCFLAEDATKWANNELEKVKDFLMVSMNKHSNEGSFVNLQDGGELRNNTLSDLPEGVWQDFQKEFLNHH